MIKFSNGGKLLTTKEDAEYVADYVSKFDNGYTLYADMETSSRDFELKSLNPWAVENCRTWLFIFSINDEKDVFAIPRDLISLKFLQLLLDRASQWINHNVKYDYHVIRNDLGLEFAGDLVCTLNLAKIIDNDRMITRGGYKLKALSRTMLGKNIDEFESRLQPFLEDNLDYGQVPLDILADYGCQDVVTNRELSKELNALLPDSAKKLAKTAIKVTRYLADVERRGLDMNREGVQIQCYRDLLECEKTSNKLEELLGYSMNPSSPVQCYDVFINRFGLPVVYTETKEGKEPAPTFTDGVLKEYEEREDLTPLLKEVIQSVRHYRKLSTHIGLFWRAWLNTKPGERIHCNYKQNVVSGRMACGKPNMQQCDKIAKSLIVPRKGYAFLSFDYKQIEFRLIAHFTKALDVIAEYLSNPDADYHDVIAKLCEVTRNQAKTLNFMIAFGGGRKRVVKELRKVLSALNLSDVELARRANFIYDRYYQILHTLKQTQKDSEKIAQYYGFIENPFGRRCHLHEDFTHVAFNRVVQSTAADLMKERFCEVTERTSHRDWGIVALVHDEFLFEVPEDEVDEAREFIEPILIDTPMECSVPMGVSFGSSTESWADAGS